MTHQEFMYGDGSPGSRATEVFTSLQSGHVGQACCPAQTLHHWSLAAPIWRERLQRSLTILNGFHLGIMGHQG